MSICEKHIWPAFKLLLKAGTPIQNIFDLGGETHLFLNNQTIEILKNDGKYDEALLFDTYRNYVDLGNIWADKGWKYLAHYYRPDTGKGLIPFASAITECNTYFNAALHNWKSGKIEKSMFYLGASAHILQDMCVPHHAKGIALNGHRKFEIWIMNNKNKFKIKKGGYYNYFKDINDIINYNSSTAQNYYPDVSCYNITGYIKAGRELLTLAQKTTAFLFSHFFSLLNHHQTKKFS
ncbi:MAG: zinc dependent phospholipase C family protein [Bacillota bacterium]